jgi:hypothetical protein
MKIIINLIIFIFISLQTFGFSSKNDLKPFPELPLLFKNAEKINQFTTRIPFKLVDRLIVIEGELNDQKGNFIIDTGSETLLLNKNYFKTYPFNYAKKGETSGVTGSVEMPIEKRIKSLAFKNLNLKNKNSDVINLSHIEKNKKIKLLGIIGYSILKDYEIFIDLFLNQITLTKIDKDGNRLGKQNYLEEIIDTLNFKLKKHVIVVDGFINKEKVTFGIDTGAEFNQLNSKLSKDVFNNFYPKKRVELIVASSKKIEVLYGNLHRLKLNDQIYFGPMKTIVTNLHNMNKAFGTKLDGILGHDFFAQQRVIINYKKEKLYFIKYPILRN